MPPRNERLYTLITRPRISLVTISCTRELTMVKTPISEAPEKNSMTPLIATDFDMAKPEIPAPRQISRQSARRPLWRILPNAATLSDPAMDPKPEQDRKSTR